MKIKKDIDDRSKAFIYNITFDVRKIYFENEKEDENIYHDTLWNKKFQIKKWDYTDNMHKYLNIHKERVLTIQEY